MTSTPLVLDDSEPLLMLAASFCRGLFGVCMCMYTVCLLWGFDQGDKSTHDLIYKILFKRLHLLNATLFFKEQ